MNTRNIFSAALLAAALASAARAAVSTYTVPKTATPPTLDAGLDDPCWKTALAITDFGVLGRAKNADPVPPTTAWLAYDRDYLYLAYRCGEPLADKMRLKATEHDGSTWGDDCVEIFFNPSGDRRRYMQIVVNAAGVVMDAWYENGPMTYMDRAYETGIEVKTHVGKDEWTLESRIPFAGLPLAGPTGPWTFHLARTRAAAGQHLTALRSPAAGFHDITSVTSEYPDGRGIASAAIVAFKR